MILTVIDNENDLAEWGQNLYFNNNGQKTCLTGKRLSDYKENQAQEIAARHGISLEEARSQLRRQKAGNPTYKAKPETGIQDNIA